MIETTLRENLPAPAKADPKMETTPVNEFLEQADFFQQAGNTVAALAELERALELDPKNPRLIEALGSGLFQQERFEEARRQFRHLIELQPRNAMAYTRLAMTSYVTDRYDEFESALGLAMEIDPELPEMLHFMGKINLDQERHYDAGRIFGKLVELEPTNVQNLLALAMCLYQGGQTEAAKDTYERALQMDPENKIAWANLMEIEKSASPTEPENVIRETEPNPEPLNALLQKAQAALEQGEPQRAIAVLENVLTQNPAEVALLTALGNLYFAGGQLDEALEYFRRNSDLQPKDVVVQLQTATTALLAEDYETFETYMERALELEPENPHGLKLLATANFRAQKYKEAAELYRQALPGMPEDVEIILAMGVCFHNLGDLPTAESCFKRALEIDPYSTVASENLKALANATIQPETEIQSNGHIGADVLKDIRNQAQAKAADDPENLPTAALVGNLDHAQELLGQGLHIESWQETLKAIEQRPFHPEAYLHLAEIALEAGDAQQAAKCLEALNALTPSWEIPQQALEAIRQQSLVQSSEIDWPALPENTTDPRLSVCLIVKDEEQFLGDALQSVKAIAQQIIVVDTGSTDRTVEIAEEHGAEVHHFEWCDDFSAARNVALEHARGNWVLVLDADEILPADEIEHLRADLARANHLGYRLPLVNIIKTDQGEDETADGLCYVPRLFRNAPGLHFVGRVHEQIYSSVLVRQIDWQMDSGIGTTCLHHFGYTPEVKIERDKVKRNLKLLEMAMDEQPAEPSMLMNYALDLFNDGQLEAALEKDQEAFALLSKHTREDVLPEVRERLVSVYCYHLLQAELYEELVEIATSPLAIDCGPTASIEYVHGLALLKLERFEEAIEPFRKCIAKRDEPAFTARFKGVEGHGPHHLLADCLAKTGQEEAATAEYEQALEMAPEATSVRHGYAHYLTELEQPEKAVKLLFDAIENGSIDARLWSLGCHIVNGHLNDSEVALHWTDCAIDEFPKHPEIGKQRGIALLTVGNFKDALVFFEKTPQHPLNEGARILCHIAVGQATRLSDPDKEQLISTAFMEWYHRLLERGQNESANRVVENIDALE
ncbi:MAG: tetratricopeptide repeat protein, partial [Pedosphaera sp.]|nr:tetratricopeptide repeat protein [Pedosphaera sp.]